MATTLSSDQPTRRSVYRLTVPDELRRAGPDDLIELSPIPGSHPLFLKKKLLETLVYSIVAKEIAHLSGPSGSCKSSLLEALCLEQINFQILCESLGFAPKPLRMYCIEMATFETPGELYQRRALRDSCTFDEPSKVVLAIKDACAHQDQAYCLVWLREMGRVHSPSVQGGLLNLLSKDEIVLPDDSRISGRGIAWVADSNYQAEADGTFSLVPLDDALKRRFSVNITLGYLQPDQETEIVRRIVQEELAGEDGRSTPFTAPIDAARVGELAELAVRLGTLIRARKAEGQLPSAVVPTIYGYLSFVRMALRISHKPLPDVASDTMLGGVSDEDLDHVAAIFNEVFGLQVALEEEPTLGGNIL